jgi:hypothetical protein
MIWISTVRPASRQSHAPGRDGAIALKSAVPESETPPLVQAPGIRFGNNRFKALASKGPSARALTPGSTVWATGRCYCGTSKFKIGRQRAAACARRERSRATACSSNATGSAAATKPWVGRTQSVGQRVIPLVRINSATVSQSFLGIIHPALSRPSGP